MRIEKIYSKFLATLCNSEDAIKYAYQIGKRGFSDLSIRYMMSGNTCKLYVNDTNDYAGEVSLDYGTGDIAFNKDYVGTFRVQLPYTNEISIGEHGCTHTFKVDIFPDADAHGWGGLRLMMEIIENSYPHRYNDRYSRVIQTYDMTSLDPRSGAPYSFYRGGGTSYDVSKSWFRPYSDGSSCDPVQSVIDVRYGENTPYTYFPVDDNIKTEVFIANVITQLRDQDRINKEITV